MKFLAGLCGDDDEPSRPASTPVPQSLSGSRAGLYVGYFGASEEQITATADHVNLLFAAFLGTDQMTTAAIQRAAMATVLVVEGEVYPEGKYAGSEAARTALRAKFTTMQSVLHYVVALYPVDEPDGKALDVATIRAGNTDVRAVCMEFPELAGLPLWVIYGREFPAMADFDAVGRDDYGTRSVVPLPPLGPKQLEILVPGGCDSNDGTLWRADPRPFYAYAQQTPRVIAIICFIFTDQWGGTQSLGIRSNGMLPAYRAVGQAIVNAANVG